MHLRAFHIQDFSFRHSTLQTVLDLQGHNLESIYKVSAAFQVTTVSLKMKYKDHSKDPITGNKRKLKI